MDYKSKGEIIEYAIKKECQQYNLTEWCKTWGITVDEFYSFLEFGRQGFNSNELRAKSCFR